MWVTNGQSDDTGQATCLHLMKNVNVCRKANRQRWEKKYRSGDLSFPDKWSLPLRWDDASEKVALESYAWRVVFVIQK